MSAVDTAEQLWHNQAFRVGIIGCSILSLRIWMEWPLWASLAAGDGGGEEREDDVAAYPPQQNPPLRGFLSQIPLGWVVKRASGLPVEPQLTIQEPKSIYTIHEPYIPPI